MKTILLHSKNLDNSLVFYRSLFNRMPAAISPAHIRFEMDQFRLEIKETGASKYSAAHHLEVHDHLELMAISKRMSRFKSIERFKEDCEVINQAIGLTDPDGNRWVIGNPEVEVNFEKCYINTETFNLK